jgi:hypothetical protein
MCSSDRIDWRDSLSLGLDGRAWSEGISSFARLPDRAQAAVIPEVWERSRNPAGMSLRFRSNATEIHARWTIGSRGPGAGAPVSTCLRGAGLDCYGRSDAGWFWVGTGQPKAVVDNEDVVNKAPIDGQYRPYRIYLPLGVPVSSASVGVPAGARLDPEPPDTRKPIVVHGTSIVQGAGVSRPGLCWPSILGRRLDYPVVNMGFSSFGRMDEPVARLLAEVDAAIYVVDCLPNLGLEMLRERMPALVEIIRRSRPSTPILFAGDRLFGDSFFIPSRRDRQKANSDAQREIFLDLRRRGVEGLHLVEKKTWFGDEFEGSTDTVHANDIGALRIAEAMEPVVKRLLCLPERPHHSTEPVSLL